MNCNLSSTGLQNIDANEIIADNININTDLNVSGFSLLNSLIVNNTTTLLSSLNVSGFTSLNNNTTLLSSLNVSGFTTLNNRTTLLSSLSVSGFTTLGNETNINAVLYLSGLNVLETLETHGTAISTLHRFRSDNPQAIVSYNTNNGSTEIHGYDGEIVFDTTQTMSLTKIDINGKLNVYHDFDELLPTHLAGYWVVHDKLAYLLKQDLSNIANEIIQQVEIARVAGIATGTAATLAALVLLFGVGSILQSILGGGDGGGEGTPVIDMFAINLSINENKNNLNSLSTNSMLSITSILGCINTGFSSLHVSGVTTLNNNVTLLSSLNVSGFTTLNNNVTLLSSLNVSGFTTLNNNITLLSSLNVSGLTTLNNNVTFLSSLNVSGFTTLNNTTIISNLNVSGFTILKNNTTLLSNLNVSGFTTLNNTNISSNLNVLGFTTLFNNITIRSNLNVLGSTTLNNTTISSNLNVSGFTTLKNTTITSNLNVSGFTILNNATILSSLNISGLTTLSNNTTINGILNVSSNSFLNGQVGIGTISTLSRLTVGSNYTMGLSDGLCLNASTQLNQYNLNLYANLQAPLENGYKFTVNNNGSLKDALTIGYNGLIGIGTSNPTSLLDIPTVYDFDYANDLLNFRNTFGYGIYATSIGINGHGNTLNFLSTDYNNGIVTTRNILDLKPDGNVNMESLKVSGKVVFGQEFNPVSDIVFSVYDNVFITKGLQLAQNNYIGDTIVLETLGRSASSSIIIDNNIKLNSMVGFTRITSKSLDFTGNDGFQLWAGTTTASTLSSDGNTILLTSPLTTVSNNLNVGGVLSVSGKVQGYIASRLPIYFTTNRTVTINSINFSAYDINLNLYTRFLTLDGRKIRQFRLRSWHASGNFENVDSNYMALSYEVFMSDLNGLNILSYTRPYNNSNLSVSIYNKVIPLFYRNTFDIITYLSPIDTYGSSVKVYCVFEDLL